MRSNVVFLEMDTQKSSDYLRRIKVITLLVKGFSSLYTADNLSLNSHVYWDTRYLSMRLEVISELYQSIVKLRLHINEKFCRVHLRHVRRFYAAFLFSKRVNAIYKIFIDCSFWRDDFEN